MHIFLPFLLSICRRSPVGGPELVRVRGRVEGHCAIEQVWCESVEGEIGYIQLPDLSQSDVVFSVLVGISFLSEAHRGSAAILWFRGMTVSTKSIILASCPDVGRDPNTTPPHCPRPRQSLFTSDRRPYEP